MTHCWLVRIPGCRGDQHRTHSCTGGRGLGRMAVEWQPSRRIDGQQSGQRGRCTLGQLGTPESGKVNFGDCPGTPPNPGRSSECPNFRWSAQRRNLVTAKARQWLPECEEAFESNRIRELAPLLQSGSRFGGFCICGDCEMECGSE